MLYRKWQSEQLNTDKIQQLKNSLGVSSLLAKVLISKGADTAEKAREMFLETGALSDPYLLKDMDIAVDRIRQAVENGEKIVIYGDYDVDGVCATATLFTCLENMGANVFYKLPNREKDGYGLNAGILQSLKNKGVDLVVTVDNGIAAISEVEFARSIGLDIIVTDHHLPKGEIPDALAVVDPLRKDDTSPCKTLCGAGVAFKLVCALEEADPMEMLDYYGDFVAVGTVADLMLLEGENRTIVKAGLALLNEGMRQGFNSIIEVCGLKGKEITSESIAYAIGPRINAAGRMADPTIALELLLSEDEDEALLLAQQLETENHKRQDIQNKMAEDITQEILSDPDMVKDRVIVVWGKNYHPGVVGIVASRLVETYAKPAIVLTRDGEYYKGSGRSVANFNLHRALEQTKDLLIRYGGHELAAGLTLEEENLENFRRAINDVAANVTGLEKTESLMVDCQVTTDEISVDSVMQLDFLAPFGNGNPTPTFMVSGVQVAGIYPVSDGKHLRIKVKNGGSYLQGVMFNVSPSEFAYNTGDYIDITANLSIYTSDMGSMVSVRIKEVRPAGLADSVIDSYDLYRLYKANPAITQQQKQILCPSRQDVADIYRYISQGNVPCDDIRPLFVRFGSMDSGRIQVIIDVLLELGLIETTQSAGKNCFKTVKVSQKRDLSTSIYIKELQS
ncbi:MAG: single-stranded-DNA-specific exonuclease RecJ [Oscillospiraceae bacterium]|nr:single-stranded-DNA-specific exonuclease RecJ [Oscillospiraceae bacterium]